MFGAEDLPVQSVFGRYFRAVGEWTRDLRKMTHGA